MAIVRSRVTSQGQISVPLDVRRKLGIGPGSVLEWEDENGKMTVRRAVRYSSEDIHQALFPAREANPKTIDQMKDGIRRRIKERHARD